MRRSGGNQKDHVSEFVKQLQKIEVARQDLESLITAISLASAINLNRDIDAINEDAARKNLEIRAKAVALSEAEDRLAEMLNSNKELSSAFKNLEKNAAFSLDSNASTKERMLREELSKPGVGMQQAQAPQPLARSITPQGRAAVPQTKPPQRSASAPHKVNPLSVEEIAFRSKALDIVHFVGNEFYNLNHFDSVRALTEKIKDELMKGETRTYKNLAEIRAEVCEELNKIIGNNTPAKMTSSKEVKKLDEKYMKAAMCIQQLGGVVENEAYAKIAAKKLEKPKKLPEDAIYYVVGDDSAPKPPAQARKNSLTK